MERSGLLHEIDELSHLVWEKVSAWDVFSKSTIGGQLTRSLDSVTANIAEGDGRFHWKDKLRFLYIARGSLKESYIWIEKAMRRNLFTGLDGIYFLNDLEECLGKLNAFVSNFKRRMAFTHSPSSPDSPIEHV